jgi:hypothetical protein
MIARRRWRFQAASCVFLVVLVPECAAPIVQFEATPRRTCPGGRAKLTWSVHGDARLDAQPPVEGLGSVASQGTLSVPITQTTLFTLSAKGCWSSGYAEQNVAVLTDAVVAGEATECQGSAIIAQGQAEAGVWFAGTRIQVVRNLESRPLSVEHASVKFSLGPGQSTDGFRGANVDGPWVFTTQLLPAEECGNPQRAPQTHFRVGVVLDCSQEG